MSGPAARALGDLARERWRASAGTAGADRRRGALLARRCWSHSWPMSTSPSPHHRARWPGTGARDRAAVAGRDRRSAAQRLRRAEYFANRRIAEAIAGQLGRADTAGCIVMNPASAKGWLKKAIDHAAKLFAMVEQADVHDRFPDVRALDRRRSSCLRAREGADRRRLAAADGQLERQQPVDRPGHRVRRDDRGARRRPAARRDLRRPS